MGGQGPLECLNFVYTIRCQNLYTTSPCILDKHPPATDLPLCSFPSYLPHSLTQTPHHGCLPGALHMQNRQRSGSTSSSLKLRWGARAFVQTVKKSRLSAGRHPPNERSIPLHHKKMWTKATSQLSAITFHMHIKKKHKYFAKNIIHSLIKK